MNTTKTIHNYFLHLTIILLCLLFCGCEKHQPAADINVINELPAVMEIQYEDDSRQITNSLDIKTFRAILEDCIFVETEEPEVNIEEYNQHFYLSYKTSDDTEYMYRFFRNTESGVVPFINLTVTDANRTSFYSIENPRSLFNTVAQYSQPLFKENSFTSEDDPLAGKLYTGKTYEIEEDYILTEKEPTLEDLTKLYIKASSLMAKADPNRGYFQSINSSIWDFNRETGEYKPFSFKRFNMECQYYKVTFAGLNSYDDVRNLLSSVLSNEAIEELIGKYQEIGTLLEKDGSLYHSEPFAVYGYGHRFSWVDSFEKTDDEDIVLKIKYEFFPEFILIEGTQQYRYQDFHLKYMDGMWKFTDLFDIAIEVYE